ncbi:MAG TPA: YHS domain-containing (seleno)protein [Bradyrhizobium sp.]|uniref:YHS domain-containing (seleno)protein n=1 Tax=Bradyrhizobium sp. TaxID=376 RepID=UPI002B4A859E|nr:YHS domain-containing (seleno)protein [Bradyrhizobium sp.]HKO69548.1 YHS domain-containing (seleno)protein [Bradyrhizobium sp.]
MTARRQERNRVGPGSQFRSGIAPIALVLASLANSLWQSPAPASTTERVVVNRYTGLAIEGFDPVGYFVDAGPVIGQEGCEASQAGAVWRFRNEGNRAAFIAHPEIYGPQFGGYDPVDIARGVTVAGNPRFWLISGRRLYLFGREQTRDAFSADAARLLQEASQRWPALQQELTRY